MRYMFRTQYRQDIALWRHNGDRFWYGLLAVVVMIVPLIFGEFYVGELGAVYIFAIAGVGLMLLVGYTGLISLGHAAFLGIGAYVNAVLLNKGVPFLITLPVAGLFTALCGAAIGRPTLRMSGLYLAIATLAFGSIVGTVFQKWDSVTGGFDGFAVPTPYVFGIAVDGATGIYYVSLAVLVFVLWVAANLLRSPTGRAMVAIRDSEVSAQSMGIHLARYKTLVFAISAGMTGLAGALFAHYVRFLAPDAFDVLLSVQFVTIVFVGGLGSLRGAVLGAMFVRLLPQFIAIMRDDLEPSLFGLVLVLVILFQPGGLNGMWLKAKRWFQAFPFQRQASFRRQKAYAKSERLR
jgi:branched-chain amino acid transport system permease protein